MDISISVADPNSIAHLACKTPVVYFVFDLLYLDGYDLRNVPLIERKRLPHEQDGLLWFCERCNHLLYEEYFHLLDIENDFPKVFEHFYRSLERRTCTCCSHVNPCPAHFEDAAQLDPT